MKTATTNNQAGYAFIESFRTLPGSVFVSVDDMLVKVVKGSLLEQLQQREDVSTVWIKYVRIPEGVLFLEATQRKA